LVDYNSLKKNTPSERIENAFEVAEKYFGVHRLLDPEGNFHVTLLFCLLWQNNNSPNPPHK